MRNVSKRFILIVFVLCFLSSFSYANSAEKRSFFLSDAEFGKGRLFTVELKASGIDDIGAFEAEIEYDPEVFVFRGISTEDSNAESSSCSVGEGKVSIVYICKEGRSASSETIFLLIDFRALTDGTSEIKLNVTDAVDSAGQDIKDILSLGCTVTVNSRANSSAPTKGTRPSRAEKVDSTETFGENSEETDDETTQKNRKETERNYKTEDSRTKGNALTGKTVVAIVLAGVLCVIVTAFVAYKAGMKKQQMQNYKTLHTISDEIKKRKKDGKEE